MKKDISLDKPIAGTEFSSGTIRLFYLAFSKKKNFVQINYGMNKK